MGGKFHIQPISFQNILYITNKNKIYANQGKYN